MQTIKLKILTFVAILFINISSFVNAQTEDTLELDTTIIKGNTELPKILYVVPWQDDLETEIGEQRLVLHSLFGDVFEPTAPKEAQLVPLQFN